MKKIKEVVREAKKKVKEHSGEIEKVILVTVTGVIAYKFGCKYTEFYGDLGLKSLFADGVLKIFNPETGEQIDPSNLVEFMKVKYNLK